MIKAFLSNIFLVIFAFFITKIKLVATNVLNYLYVFIFVFLFIKIIIQKQLCYKSGLFYVIYFLPCLFFLLQIWRQQLQICEIISIYLFLLFHFFICKNCNVGVVMLAANVIAAIVFLFHIFFPSIFFFIINIRIAIKIY